MRSQYDDLSGDIRRDQLDRAESQMVARRERQASVAQTAAEEIAAILLELDTEDVPSMIASAGLLDTAHRNAKAFILEALENKRLRRSLSGI